MTAKSTPATCQSDQLLAWYDHHRRKMPWRSAPGEAANPYHVWLSEIMLQQTTVVTAVPYFTRFIERWPAFEDLAASELDDVLKMWAGLGYYARARNLHKCARVIMAKWGGEFPRTQQALLQLPGIGPYTAAAISAIAFGRRAVVVDGNVERVMARMFAIEEPLPQAKPVLQACAQTLTPHSRPGDYAQAVMDLGATVCKPRKPQCALCPWRASCCGRKRGIHEQLPNKIKKPPKPTRHGVAFWVQRKDGKVLLRKRKATGLLGGMMEIPSSPWGDKKAALSPDAHAPLKTNWHRDKCQPVRHTFTHFHLEIDIWLARTDNNPTLADAADEERCDWVSIDDLTHQALPSLMRKIVVSALDGSGVE